MLELPASREGVTMHEYTLYWEDEGAPHEDWYEARDDQAAVEVARRTLGANLDGWAEGIDNVLLQREVPFA